MKTAIVNARLYDYKHYCKRGYVIFDDTIEEVGDMIDFVDKGYEIVNAHGGFLLPNLVCSHAHIYSIFARGLALPFDPHNFQDILDQMWWKMDHYIDNETTYYSGIVAAYEFMLHGVTTIIDHHASGLNILDSLNSLSKAVSETAGLRGIYCFETSDRYNVEACIHENLNFMKEKSPHAAGLFGMHASMSLSNDTLDCIAAKLGKQPIHIHVAECRDDEADSESKYGMTIIERLDKHHLLNPDSLIVHGVHMMQSEIELIKQRNCYIVCNTTSNMNNAVGLPSIKTYLDCGIPVLIGNDGLSTSVANEYVNALFTSHLRERSPVALGLGDILQMINNSFDYAGRRLGIKLGRFEKGYVADFAISPYIPPTAIDESNVFGHVFYGLFNAYAPKEVYADGKLVVHNYKVASHELEKDYKYAHLVANKLWKRIKKGE